MGISPEQHRLRIGLHAGGHCPNAHPSATDRQETHHGPKIGRLLPSVLLCLLLLLISGVEPNPGPQYKCKMCPAITGSVEAYFDHQKEFHAKVPCLHEDCPFQTASSSIYRVHVSRCHDNDNSKTSHDDVQCPVPNCQVPKRKTMKIHLEEHLELGHSFKCPFGANCTTVHTKIKSFRVHIQVHMQQMQPEASSKKNVPQVTAPPYQEQGAKVCPDPFPPNKIKEDISIFYLALEGKKILPSVTVQFISEKIAFFTEMSHHCLKKALTTLLLSVNVTQESIQSVLRKAFSVDPVFNVHHKSLDPEQVSTKYFRRQQLEKYFAFVASIEIQLPGSRPGQKKVAQYVPLRKSLETVLQDPDVRCEILKSFTAENQTDILQDFRDGAAFKEHLTQNGNHECIHLIFFMDAFEFCPFGPASGMYKTHGMYFTIGNLPAEHRSKLENIVLALLLLDANLKPTEQEHLDGVNKFEEAFDRLIKDLQELNSYGLEINGRKYPVCFLFCSGDNLGAHQIGSFVQSFHSGHCCRFCRISMERFRNELFQSPNLRTSQHYDECVLQAKQKWVEMKEKAIQAQHRRREIYAAKIAAGQEAKEVPNSMVSKNALKKLKAVNHEGVKPLPSALNKIPGFHVGNHGLPPCLAHDLFEGVVDGVLAKILEHFIETKKWFSLPTLNRRIKDFKYQGKDADDAPNAIKSYDGIKGHAVETWTLLRLLPLLIGDLIKDEEDSFWQLYLSLKKITEYICAPKITRKQLAYLQTLINSYLSSVKALLPACLTSKQHLLSHYPYLINTFGPLIRLWTMRFESKHAFFKQVGKTCKSFKNILITLARKYQFRFAYDHLSGYISPDVVFDSEPTEITVEDLPSDVQEMLPPNDGNAKLKTVYDITLKSIYYKINNWMILDKEGIMDLSVGQIYKILVYEDNSIYFVFRLYYAENSLRGYYVINEFEHGFKVVAVKDLPDFEPLPAYEIDRKQCIALKHSLVFM